MYKHISVRCICVKVVKNEATGCPERSRAHPFQPGPKYLNWAFAGRFPLVGLPLMYPASEQTHRIDTPRRELLLFFMPRYDQPPPTGVGASPVPLLIATRQSRPIRRAIGLRPASQPCRAVASGLMHGPSSIVSRNDGASKFQEGR
jgi:hypothetical protein